MTLRRWDLNIAFWVRGFPHPFCCIMDWVSGWRNWWNKPSTANTWRVEQSSDITHVQCTTIYFNSLIYGKPLVFIAMIPPYFSISRIMYPKKQHFWKPQKCRPLYTFVNGIIAGVAVSHTHTRALTVRWRSYNQQLWKDPTCMDHFDTKLSSCA